MPVIEYRRNERVAIFQVYNRWSWLNAMSKVTGVSLEHEDAPVLEKFSIGQFRRLLAGFRAVHGGIAHDLAALPAYGGDLFDPDRFPFLEGPE